jgi:hypothetical protein
MSPALARSIAQLLFGLVATTAVGLTWLLVRDAHRAGLERLRRGGER